jgi:RNA polymerase sigma factor (TIGR02999 family)
MAAGGAPAAQYARTVDGTRMDAAVDLTLLLHRAHAGDTAAAKALFQATYPLLRRIAHARLRSHRRQTLLDTTSLVHEWYLRFTRTRGLLEDRQHFLRYAARAMRTIIVDFARAGGARRRNEPEVVVSLPIAAREEILAVHGALATLSTLDARMADVVELRYYGGLRETEVAEVLGITERTVRRDWEKARLWLARALA